MKIVSDRVPTKPGMVQIAPEGQAPFYAVMTRADEPITDGTPINKALFDDLQGFVPSKTIFQDNQIVTVTGNVTTTTVLTGNTIETIRTDGTRTEKSKLIFTSNGFEKEIL